VTASPEGASLISVAPDDGALVRPEIAPGSGGNSLFLVTDTGVKYPLPATEATALGYRAGRADPLPAALLGLLPTGPALDLPALRNQVSLRLDAINGHLHEFRDREESRIKTYRERVGRMRSRIRELERESHSLHVSLQEEQRLAMIDALTGIPNRAAYDGRMEQEFRRWKRFGRTVAIIAWDIDRFKAINESLGRNIGAGLLACVADRIRAVLGPAVLAGRRPYRDGHGWWRSERNIRAAIGGRVGTGHIPDAEVSWPDVTGSAYPGECWAIEAELTPRRRGPALTGRLTYGCSHGALRVGSQMRTLVPRPGQDSSVACPPCAAAIA